MAAQLEAVKFTSVNHSEIDSNTFYAVNGVLQFTRKSRKEECPAVLHFYF